MLNFHKDHQNLVNVALLVFVLLSMGVAVIPASEMAANNTPLPDMQPLTPSERRGLEVYVAEGCVACHTQQVRNIDMDRMWGERPSIPSDYHYSKRRMDLWRQSPSLLGSERTGPDLTDIGRRQPGAQWHLLHLFDPRMVVKGSVMPRYPWLFELTKDPGPDAVRVPVPKDRLEDTAQVVVAGQRALDLVAYLLTLKQAPLPTAETPSFLPSPKGGKAEAGAAADAGTATGAALPEGGGLFTQTCSACHGAEGKGLPGAFPPLAGSPVVNDPDPTQMLTIILGGYDARPEFGVMPPQAQQLTDEQVAAIANFVRSSFGNDAPPTDPGAVKAVRGTVAPETALLP